MSSTCTCAFHWSLLIAGGGYHGVPVRQRGWDRQATLGKILPSLCTTNYTTTTSSLFSCLSSTMQVTPAARSRAVVIYEFRPKRIHTSSSSEGQADRQTDTRGEAKKGRRKTVINQKYLFNAFLQEQKHKHSRWRKKQPRKFPTRCQSWWEKPTNN